MPPAPSTTGRSVAWKASLASPARCEQLVRARDGHGLPHDPVARREGLFELGARHNKVVDRLAFGTADAVVPRPRVRVGVLPLFFREEFVDLGELGLRPRRPVGRAGRRGWRGDGRLHKISVELLRERIVEPRARGRVDGQALLRQIQELRRGDAGSVGEGRSRRRRVARGLSGEELSTSTPP